MIKTLNKANKSNSLSLNFIFDSILKVFNLLFPLITFPYLARVLSPSGIGIYEFTLSFVNIFILLAQLGVPLYGVRLLANLKNNQLLLTKAFKELLIISLFSSILASAFYLIFLFFNSSLNQTIALILGLNIILSSLNVEWLYQALEEYSYITIRSVIVKIITVIFIFTFVKNQSDLMTYIIIILSSVFVNAMLNLINARKFLLNKIQYKLNIFQHLKPLLFLFLINVSVSIYVNLDKVMLGFLTSNYDVGIYATANKLIKIVIVFLTSYGTVAFPRIIGDLNAGNEIKAKTIFNQIFLFIIFISFPLISFFYGFSNSIILLLGGEDFKDSIVTFNIMIPLLLVIPLSNFFGLQILMAYKKEKFILFTTIFGALLNFTINLLLIPILKANGAAIATIITESFITLLQFYFVLIKLKINFPWLNFFKYFFLSVIIFPIFIVIGTLNLGNLLTLIYGVLILVPLYLTILVIIKDDFLFNLINGIKSFIKSTMNL